jgi:hypothetical protein
MRAVILVTSLKFTAESPASGLLAYAKLNCLSSRFNSVPALMRLIKKRRQSWNRSIWAR